jgi:hypothetical protein
MLSLSYEDLNKRYEEYTSWLRCECAFATEMVGGQPATEEGVRQFVKYHLKLTDEKEAEAAVKRILHEEVENVTPPEGEIPEGKMYGLRAVRNTNGWPWLGDWMIKAAIKQASSGLYVFQQVLGTKRSFAESSRVRAWKYSLQDPRESNVVYICHKDSDTPAETYYKQFMGRVQTPQGPVSIIHQSQCVAPGSRFAFEFRFMPVKNLKEDAIRDMLAMMMIVGLGSARSLERGKFRILHAELELAEHYKAKAEEPKKLVIKPPEDVSNQPVV